MKAGKLLFSVALAGVFLILFLRGVAWSEVAASFRAVRPVPLVLAILIVWATLWLRAWRWRTLLTSLGGASWSETYHATAIGFGASVILPLKAGEVIRPVLLARRGNLPIAAVLATAVVERIFDLIAVLGLAAFALIWPRGIAAEPTELARMRSGALLGVGGLVVGVALLALLAVYRERLVRVAVGATRFLPPRLHLGLEHLLRHGLEGLATLAGLRQGAWVVFQTLALWLVIDVQTYCGLLAFGLELPFRATYVVVAMGAVGLAFGTPGGVGSFHKTTQLAVGLYAVPAAAGAAFAIGQHLVCFVPILIAGAVSMFRLGMGWSGLTKNGRNADSTPPLPQ